MLIKKLGEREYRLNHITRRVKAGTFLVLVLPPGSRLGQNLKQRGMRSGSYCRLLGWTTNPTLRVALVGTPNGGSFYVDKGDLQHIYTADKYFHFQERVHRAEVKAIQEQLDALRSCHP